MKGTTPSEGRVLDGRECNMLWLENGTLARVQAILTARGVRSPRTNKEISRPAIAMSVWRYCCLNPDESFEIEKASRLASGMVLTRDMWNRELIQHARCAFTSVGYRKWLKKFNLEEVARSMV